jgi:hypothetical protein
MKNNLIFTGLTESQHENTEATLREFLRCELGIEYHIEFGNVHRFGNCWLIPYGLPLRSLEFWRMYAKL